MRIVHTTGRYLAPPLILVALLVLLWHFAISVGAGAGLVPGPAQTWHRAVELISTAWVNTSQQVGIGRHLLASLGRVVAGFALATLFAVPVGIAMALNPVTYRAAEPIVQVLKPVSPLAWLPIGLALVQNPNGTALFVIIMSAVWPALVATFAAVRSVNPTYLNLAATLEVRPLTRVTHIIIPAALPGIITGLRQSLATSWLVIIAAEMLVGRTGMGYFLWNEWNRLSLDSIFVAILLIGCVGVILDRSIAAVQHLIPSQ